MSLPPTAIPPVSGPFRGHRVEGVEIHLLDREDADLGPLDGTLGGSVEHNVFAPISGGGSVTIKDVGQDIDWLNARLQPWVTVNRESWPLGVFLPSAPTSTYGPVKGWEVELLDKLSILASFHTYRSYSLPAGTVVTGAVRNLIADAGESRVAITDTTDTLSSGMVWNAGTSYLRIVNDLLSTINYFSLRCDGYGRFVAAPYTPPSARTVAWEFEAAPDAIHRPDFTHDQDIFNVPNRVLLLGAGDGYTEAPAAVAANQDPDSPYSYQSRGRWIDYVEDFVEAGSYSHLKQKAQRMLEERSAPVSTVVVEHAKLPLELNEAVDIRSQGLEIRGVVQRTRTPLQIGALMKTTIREVRS